MFLRKTIKRISDLEEAVKSIKSTKDDSPPYNFKALSNNLPEIIADSKERRQPRAVKNIIQDLEHLEDLFEQSLIGKESYYNVYEKFSLYIRNLKNQQK